MTKVILTSLVSLMAVSSAVAQGVFNWDNLNSGGPITNAAGALATSPIQAELWYAPGSGAAETNLVKAAGSAVVLGSPLDGYFFGGEVALPITGIATVQIRAWDPGTGTTWGDAEAAVGGIWGKSNLSDIALVIPPIFANDVTGWLPFKMTLNVPEPSTFALAGLGALALLVFRRRD